MHHTTHNEWVVDLGCTNYMENNATLFMRLNKDDESIIYVDDDFYLDVVGQGDVTCGHGKLFYFYNVPNIISNILSVAQLTQTSEIVEFYLDWFYA